MSNSNPSLPPAAAAAAPPPMAAPSSSSSPLRRRRSRDPDDDAPEEESELRGPFPVARHDSSSDTDNDGRHDQPGVEHDDYNPNPNHCFPSRLRRRLDALQILGLFGACAGAGAALPPSPTSSGECESDATISDDDDYHHGLSGVSGEGGFNPIGSSSSAGTSSAAVDRGWAATRKRGWKAAAAGNKIAVLSYSDDDSDLNTISAANVGDREAGMTTCITIAQAAAPTALHHHQQPPPHVPRQEAQTHPPHAPHPPPADPPRRRERQREYTCKECGKSYPTNQALGGHAAGHKNKKREAEAMAAAMAAAAAAAGGASTLDAAFLLALRRGGGKEDKPHECRQCGKVFGSGVALGGHMRVHYTGPPIVPARKNKKRCLAPLPPNPMPAVGDIVAAAAAAPVGLELALSLKAEENVAAVAPRPVPSVVAVGLSLGLSIKAEEEVPSTPPSAETAGGGDVRVVRLFGMDISPPQVHQSPLQQPQQCSGDTKEDDSSSIGEEQQH